MRLILPILLLSACTPSSGPSVPPHADPCSKENILKHVRATIGDRLLVPDGATYDLVAEIDVNGEFHVAGLIGAHNAQDSLVRENVSFRVACGPTGPDLLDARIGDYDLLVTPERRRLAEQRLDSLMVLMHNEPAVTDEVRDERLRYLEYYRRIAKRSDRDREGILR